MQEMPQSRLDVDLEEYVYEMADQLFQGVEQNGGSGANAQPDMDVYAQLAQKEKDLILAAQLGKALLEKNEDLSRQNEKIAEDFSHKLEILEQEKYILRRKLDNVSGEYEMRVSELQVDIRTLQQELEEQQEQLREADRDKHHMIRDLTEQNQRLTSRLKEAAKVEENLNTQLQSLRDQFNNKRSTLTENASQLELLKEEISLLSDKKNELERRLDQVMNERNGLNTSIDEHNDRIQMLERQSREQDYQLQTSCREMDELRATNSALVDRLENISRQSMSPVGTRNASLLSEMESSDSNSVEENEQSTVCKKDLQIDTENDSGGISSTLSSHRGWVEDGLDGIDEDIEVDELGVQDLKELRGDCLEVYQVIRGLVERLKQHNPQNVTAMETEEPKSFTIMKGLPNMGMLRSIVGELKSLVHELLRHDMGVGHDSLTALQAMEAEAHRARERADSLQRTIKQMEDEIHRKTDEIQQLHGELGVSEARLAAAEEERDTLRDDRANSHLAKDELIKKAWETRDQAVQRKNAAEIELARTRIDVMQINSQLMEAVQQKIELSQQLEQWQMDMQTLLEEQMKRKLDKQLAAEYPEDSDSRYTSKKTPTNRLLNLLRR